MFVLKQNKVKNKKCNVVLDLNLQSDKKKVSWKLSSVMTSVQTVIDQELAQFGWVESIATNSISDFKSSKSNIMEQTTDEKDSDLADQFICHLIFYMIFCYSLFLYFLIDLGFGSYIRKNITKLIQVKLKEEGSSFIQVLPN